jgi:chromosome segregation ATPase
LTEAEKGQVELRKALADKEAELVVAHKEVAEERRRGADTNHLRGKLRTIEAEIRSLQRRHGILRSDLEEARSKEKQMEKAFDSMKADMDQLRKRWEQVQARLVAEVERTNAENTRLHQVISDQQAELDRERKEREAAERRHRQKQAELGLAQLELAVAKEDVRMARAGRDDMLKENDRLRKELGNRAFTAQANLKRIVERFRTQTTVAIQAAMATALQSWAEQPAELQVLRADKANRDLRGPGFWKLDQANCEAVQKNLTTDLLRLAVSHREEITKLLEFQDTLVDRMRKEMEIVAEPVKPAEPAAAAQGSEFEDDDDEETAEE